jgi:hypothetical protein
MVDLQKTLSQFRSRNHATFTFAKPAVAIAGHPIVEAIAQSARNQFKYQK